MELPDLGHTVSQAVAARLTPEFIEQEVNTRVDKLIAEAIDKSLRSWSDTGKLIEKAIEESLRVQKLDLPSYGDTVCAILKAQIEATVAPLVSGQLADDMQELLSLAPKEVKLSELADLMRERHDGDAYGDVITVIVDTSRYPSTWIYLDEDQHYPDHDKYRCAHSLLVRDDGIIATANLHGRDRKSSQNIGPCYGLEQRIRAMVACGTKLIIDEDAVITSVGDY